MTSGAAGVDPSVPGGLGDNGAGKTIARGLVLHGFWTCVPSPRFTNSWRCVVPINARVVAWPP